MLQCVGYIVFQLVHDVMPRYFISTYVPVRCKLRVKLLIDAHRNVLAGYVVLAFWIPNEILVR